MKINKAIKSLFLILLISILLFATNGVYATAEDETPNTKNLVLDNYERKEFEYTPIETITEVSIEEIPQINEISEHFLIDQEKDISNIQNVQKVYDRVFNRETIRVILQDAEIDFNEAGDIVEYKNLDDFSTVDKDKRDYVEGEELPEIEYQFNEVSELSDIISYLESVNDLSEYELITCDNDLKGVWSLVWCRDYGNGLLNPYDCYSVVIDAKDGSIMVYGKNKIEPNTLIPIITEEEAIEIARPITSKFDGNVNVKLSFFRPNFYWEDGKLYEQANFIRLSWNVSIEDCMDVRIDAITGENLGGGVTKSTDCARSMFLENFVGQTLCAQLGYNALNTLGYNQVYYPYIDYFITQGDIGWMLARPDVYGMYLSSHGGCSNGISYLTAHEPGGVSWWTVPSNQSYGNWHFVYLDACLTSANNNFATAFNATGAGRCFVGWNISVNVYTALDFNQRFFPRLGSYTVCGAVIMSLNESHQAGYNEANGCDCNPGFIGDTNYDGTAW